MNPKVSVIIPVYNVEKYLDECIESVVNQTYQNIEIILIDDGSTDNCPYICDNWAKKDERIKIIHQENSGPSLARNKGINLACGDYFLFVDSDDFIVKTTIEKTIIVAEKNNVDIVCFGVFRVDEYGKIIESTEHFEKKITDCKEALIELVSGNVHDYPCNKLYRKNTFENVEFPVGKVFEDIATTYKLFLNSKKICFVPEELYFYRKRKGSIIDHMNAFSLDNLFSIRKERYNDLKVNYPEAANVAFKLTAISSLNFYDISLWEQVNPQTLKEAIDFLEKNKKEAIKINNKMKFYFMSPNLYNFYRKAKHCIGGKIKKLLSFI